LPMLDILDIGEARVFQFFCYCVGHDRLIAWFCGRLSAYPVAIRTMVWIVSRPCVADGM
jgi:hypothetical protein